MKKKNKRMVSYTKSNGDKKQFESPFCDDTYPDTNKAIHGLMSTFKPREYEPITGSGVLMIVATGGLIILIIIGLLF